MRDHDERAERGQVRLLPFIMLPLAAPLWACVMAVQWPAAQSFIQDSWAVDSAVFALGDYLSWGFHVYYGLLVMLPGLAVVVMGGAVLGSVGARPWRSLAVVLLSVAVLPLLVMVGVQEGVSALQYLWGYSAAWILGYWYPILVEVASLRQSSPNARSVVGMGLVSWMLGAVVMVVGILLRGAGSLAM